MPKTTIKKKPTSRVSAKTTLKSTRTRAKSTTRKTTASKAKVKKTGLKHHAKRLYRVTPKFVHGMVVGALVGLVTVGILGVTNLNPVQTEAAGKCDAHGIGNRTLTHNTNNSAYTINGSQTTVTFNVTGKNCKLPITMVVWKAPNGTTGKPYSAQTLFFHVTKVFGAGRHTLTGTLPGCYFQVDTVTGTKLTGSTGQAFNYDSRQVAFMHGGTTSCVKKPTPPTPQKPNPPVVPPVTIQVCDLISHEIVPIEEDDFDSTKHSKDASVCQTPPPAPPEVPETPETPDTPETVTPVAETLPNTGPGAIIIIALLSVIGGVIFHKYHHHRKGTYHKN